MPGSDPTSAVTTPVTEQQPTRPESWACDPVSPRSRISSMTGEPIDATPHSEEKKVKHRPSLSKFTFPARLSEPPPIRPDFFKYSISGTANQSNEAETNQEISPGSRPTSRQTVEVGPTEVGLGLQEEELPRPASTGDLGGDIQFRHPFRRPSVRTLYSSSLVQTSRFAADPGYGSRKASMVNPEDYRPGMSGGGNTGKAMTAGFEPPLPSDVTSRILEARASLANERKASWYPITDLNNSPPAVSDSARALKALSQHFDTDADLGDMSFEDAQDGSEHGGDSPNPADSNAMPTMYSTTFLGPLSVSSDEKLPSPDRRPSTVPRDPVTGKVDWRARLQMKPRNSIRQSISLESGSNEKRTSPFSSGANTPMSEKYSAEKFMPAKPSPNIVELDNDKYTPLGKMLLRLSPFTFLISAVATNFYLYTRAQSIIRAHNATGNPFISAWLFYAFEWVFALWTGARAIYKLCTMNFQAKPRLLLKYDFALPNVDVLVLATGQDAGMVMDTVIAAARLDWPVDKLRVLVIDESKSEILKYQVEQYSNLRAIYVTYHQRSPYAKTPRGGVWPKSSTINLGLSETRAEGRIAGQYAVILEAESIPEPGMLRALLPHMINDPLLALVQSPSAFYNLPKKLSSSFATFLNFVEPVEASRSAFAVRRTAIDDVGGFPTRSSIEDKRLNLLLKGKGYSTLFLDEPLAFSLVPDSFSKHLRQGVDRALAHFKTGARLGFFVFSFQIAHLSFSERVRGFGRAIAPFLSIIVALASIALPVSLALGGFLVPALSIGELNMMLWAALAMILSERLHDFCSNMPNGDASARGFVRSEVFKAPYIVLGLVRSMIPSFLCRAPQPYWQSQKPGERLERNPKYRQSIFKRLASVTVGTHGWPHLLLVMGILGSIGYSLYSSTVAFSKGQRGLYQTGLFILMTVGWPTLPWMDLLLGSFTPFVYAVRPPAVPSREALLNREPISGRATPLESAKSIRPFRTAFWGQAIVTGLLVGYAIAVFSLTFKDLHIN